MNFETIVNKEINNLFCCYLCMTRDEMSYFRQVANKNQKRKKERNPLQRGHAKDNGSTLGEADLSLSPIPGGGKTSLLVLVTWRQGLAVFFWPRVVPSD